MASEHSTPDFITPAIRQYQHNDCTGLLIGLDYDETMRIVANIVQEAHMAGQADAGVDPGYSNAQAYCKELFRNEQLNDKAVSPSDPAGSIPDTVLIEAAVSFLAGKFYCELSQKEHSMYAAAKEGGRIWCDGSGRLRRH